jgi:hypothetical protein
MNNPKDTRPAVKEASERLDALTAPGTAAALLGPRSAAAEFVLNGQGLIMSAEQPQGQAAQLKELSYAIEQAEWDATRRRGRNSTLKERAAAARLVLGDATADAVLSHAGNPATWSEQCAALEIFLTMSADERSALFKVTPRNLPIAAAPSAPAQRESSIMELAPKMSDFPAGYYTGRGHAAALIRFWSKECQSHSDRAQFAASSDFRSHVGGCRDFKDLAIVARMAAAEPATDLDVRIFESHAQKLGCPDPAKQQRYIPRSRHM